MEGTWIKTHKVGEVVHHNGEGVVPGDSKEEVGSCTVDPQCQDEWWDHREWEEGQTATVDPCMEDLDQGGPEEVGTRSTLVHLTWWVSYLFRALNCYLLLQQVFIYQEAKHRGRDHLQVGLRVTASVEGPVMMHWILIRTERSGLRRLMKKGSRISIMPGTTAITTINVPTCATICNIVKSS